MNRSCFLCGIGGSGVSALAQLLMARGWAVAGSDRSHDRGETPDKFKRLADLGISLHPQDGSGVHNDLGMLVVSSAVEDTVPDVKAALDLGIPIRKRADVLAEQFNQADFSIGVGGTSGKSTVTAMTGWILSQCGRDPTIINGALMTNFENENRTGNAVMGGDTKNFVAELDESDGSIALFHPTVGILTNISLDHKPMTELHRLFGDYMAASKTAILNGDDPDSMVLNDRNPRVVTFSLIDKGADFYARDLEPLDYGVRFTLCAGGKEIPVRLGVPGRHNVANALAAIAAAQSVGITPADSARALESYRGIKRRFEIVGTAGGVTVIDDFAHNPDKIAATLRTLHEKPGRVWAVFQPHGFRPTKLMKDDLVAAFVQELGDADVLVMPEIYYAGGTADKVISSRDITDEIAGKGRNARFLETRGDIVSFLRAYARKGDRIVVMGARDDTLPEFARAILNALG